MPSVITANILRTGAVVYLAADGRWVEHLADAEVANDAATAIRQTAIAHAAIIGNAITAVYAADVKIVDGRPTPLSVREMIRANRAPTV